MAKCGNHWYHQNHLHVQSERACQEYGAILSPSLSFCSTTNLVQVDLYQGMLWSSIEMGIAFLCSCLPTLGRLLPRNGIIPALSKWFSSLRTGTGTAKRSKPSFVKNTWPMASHGGTDTDSTYQLQSRSSQGEASMKGSPHGVTR